MADGIREKSQCVVCDRNVVSSSDGWKFKTFSLCIECINRMFHIH